MTSATAARAARGHDVRGVLLHRPAGHRAPHRQPGRGDRARRHARLRRARAAARDDEVRRRRRRCSTCRTAAAPGSGSPSTPGVGRALRGRHRPRRPSGSAALRRLARAGYPVGPDDRADHAGRTAGGRSTAPCSPGSRRGSRACPALDLTAECITHRFTPGSKEVLLGLVPAHPAGDGPESRRSRKRGKFGAVKYVYPRGRDARAAGVVRERAGRRLPAARVLYWT